MIESFLKYLEFEKRLSHHTVLAYKTDLQQFSDFISVTYSEQNTSHASFSMVRSWIISLVENKIDPRSINRKIACLRSFFKFLLRQEVIDKDPMLKIKILKTKKQLPSFVKEGEMFSLLDNSRTTEGFESVRNKLILELFYATGMRLSELISLTDNHIDLRNQTLK